MDNRVFYGQYSLQHWLDLILKGNVILPDYQRFFVWNESKVRTLIDTLKKKQFVPPITIGAFNENGVTQNLILDGQQRLTSILLAHLGLFPDVGIFRATLEHIANENDDEVEEEGELDDILAWDFRKLVEKGRTKDVILSKITAGNYKTVDFQINDPFLINTYLGFSYLIPETQNHLVQQKYYSSVFRNINIQGQTLFPMESRASLYFLQRDRKDFFDPPFMNEYVLKNSNIESKIDFVRFMALLSQYAINDNGNGIARGFKPRMEEYYEEYIYSVVGDRPSTLFKDFNTIFPDSEYAGRFDRLDTTIHGLDIPKPFTSIIETDIYLFGLIYCIVFENKSLDLTKKDELNTRLQISVEECREDAGHKRAPSALKYLRARIDSSIEIYDQFINE